MRLPISDSSNSSVANICLFDGEDWHQQKQDKCKDFYNNNNFIYNAQLKDTTVSY